MKLFKTIKNAIANIGIKYHGNIMDVCVEEIYNADSEDTQKYWSDRWTRHSNKQEKYVAMLTK